MPTLEEWTIERKIPEDVLTAGNTYELKNTTVDRYVIYGQREYGINLVWSASSTRDVFFAHALNAPQGTPLLYGEPIAIAVSDGGYLKHQPREYGINLVWSAERVTEWEIRGGTRRRADSLCQQPIRLVQPRCSRPRRVLRAPIRYKPSVVARLQSLRHASQTAQVPIAYRVLLGGVGTKGSFGTVLFSGQRTGRDIGGGNGDTSFQRSDQWEAPPGAQSALAHATVAGLAPGAWLIEARAPQWVAFCEVNLTAGINASLNFEENSSGCGRGFDFPPRHDIGLRPIERVEGFAAARLESRADAEDQRETGGSVTDTE